MKCSNFSQKKISRVCIEIRKHSSCHVLHIYISAIWLMIKISISTELNLSTKIYLMAKSKFLLPFFFFIIFFPLCRTPFWTRLPLRPTFFRVGTLPPSKGKKSFFFRLKSGLKILQRQLNWIQVIYLILIIFFDCKLHI